MPFNLAAAHRPAATSATKSLISSGRGGAGNLQSKHQLPPTSTLPAAKTMSSLPAQQLSSLSNMHSNASDSSLESEPSASTRAKFSESTSLPSWRNPFGSSYNATPSNPSSKASFGRGGAGNNFPEWQNALFAFDEELERSGTQYAAPVFYIGRGGSGNRHR